MPWHVENNNPECSGWAVVKDADGSVAGCHETEADAMQQVQALYAQEAEQPAVEAIAAEGDCPPGHHRMPDGSCMSDAGMPAEHVIAAGGTPWSGTLVVEDVWSGDGRQFAAGSLTWAQLPLPLKYQPAESAGHDGAVIVGRIDSITREGNQLIGRGVMDDQGMHGAEALRLMDQAMLRGVSIMADDTDDEDVEYIMPEGPAGESGPHVMVGPPGKMIIHHGRIRSATLVAEPAFAEATITLTTDTPAPPEVVGPAVVAAGWSVTIPEVWPESWFDEPVEAPPFGALHITPQGRVYGYLGPAKVSHRAFRGTGRTVTIPRGVDYSEFQNKACLVAGGDGHVYRINAGNITFDCGHANPFDPRRADPNWAVQHYDNSCSIAARVRVGENDKGTWVAGGLLHGISADVLERMMGCALSGDWQGGKLKAALLVPVEGFPVAAAARVRVRDDALVATAVPIVYDQPERPRPEPDLNVDDIYDLVASSIGYDDDSRWQRALADAGRGKEVQT